MTSVLIKNLKRFRLARAMTQEQAAVQLGVSVQSISRWECGTTLPDVTLLPAIARLYCITIDDLYKDAPPAYDNYAQRLAAIFEATHSPEDYLRADMEFRRLLDHGDCTPEDLRLYGILHQNMMQQCADQAQAMFDRVISAGPTKDPDAYWRTRRQQLSLMSQLGRGDEALARQQARLADHNDDVNEWICLIAVLDYAGAMARSRNAHRGSPRPLSHLRAYAHVVRQFEGELPVMPRPFSIGTKRCCWTRIAWMRSMPSACVMKNSTRSPKPSPPGLAWQIPCADAAMQPSKQCHWSISGCAGKS